MVTKAVKVNFTTSPEIKAWYKEEAEKQGLTMSGLMSFVLAQYKKNEEAKQVLAEINQANKMFDMGQFAELVKALNESVDKEDSGSVEG